ncbi:hypothetical protein AC249_AIPGENE919 [Exaiptasia diaphana]|nr:hypothetical protein AC249_AIPGENE919 [Exaiptasia diaphana]
MRGQGHQDYSILCGLAAEFLIDLFGNVWNSIEKTVVLPKGRKKFQPYYLPTIDATVDQRSLPLGYAWDKDQPDPEKLCDANNCVVQDHDNCRLLTCGHSFHIHCMPDGSCPVCLPNLLSKSPQFLLLSILGF